MRRSFKPTFLLMTVISLTFASTAVLARGPSGSQKKGSAPTNKTGQGTSNQGMSNHQATSTAKKAGSITILNSGKGSGSFTPVSHLQNTGEGTSGQPHPTGGTGTTGSGTTKGGTTGTGTTGTGTTGTGTTGTGTTGTGGTIGIGSRGGDGTIGGKIGNTGGTTTNTGTGTSGTGTTGTGTTGTGTTQSGPPMRSGNGYPVGWGVATPVAGGSISTVASTTAAPVTASGTTSVADDSASLTVVPAGATIKVDAQNLGPQPGRVSIVVGNVAMPGAVANWSDTAVNITLPLVEVTGPVRAKIVVRRADGSVANETPFQLAASAN